jgi:hypothetical protein
MLPAKGPSGGKKPEQARRAQPLRIFELVGYAQVGDASNQSKNRFQFTWRMSCSMRLFGSFSLRQSKQRRPN